MLQTLSTIGANQQHHLCEATTLQMKTERKNNSYHELHFFQKGYVHHLSIKLLISLV